MKALIKPYGFKGLQFVHNAKKPMIGPRDVLIRVLAASVCGTDLHIYDSDPAIRDRVAPNQIVGHEFCGEVLEIGEQVTRLAKGDMVSGESHIVCETCTYCLNGLPHLCQEVSLIGVDRPGGLAEYVAIPEKNAIPKSPSISIEVAAILDAYGNAVDVSLLVPLTGKTVLVTGCGPQGLMAIGIALAAGAQQVIATETREQRKLLAQEILRIHSNPNQHRKDMILHGASPSLVGEIFEATNGLGVDVLLEMSGHPSAIRDGLTVLKNSGHAVILGISSSNSIEIDWNELVFKAANIHFRYGRELYRTWSDGQQLLESGMVKLEPLIHTPYFALEEFEHAFRLLKQGDAAKVIFKPNDSQDLSSR